MTLKNFSSYLSSSLWAVFLSVGLACSLVWAGSSATFEVSSQLNESQQNSIRTWLQDGKMANQALNQAVLAEQNTHLQVERAQLELANAQQALEVAQYNLAEHRKALAELGQQTVAAEQQYLYQQQMDYLRQQQQLQQNNLQAVQETLKQRQQALAQAQQAAQDAGLWHTQLQQLRDYLQQQNQQQEVVAEQAKQNQRIEKLRLELNELSNSVTDLAKRSWLEAEILVATENAQLLLQDAQLEQFSHDFEQLQSQNTDLNVDALQQQLEEIKALRQQLQTLLDLLKNKLAGVARQLDLLNKQSAASNLSGAAQSYLNKAEKLLEQLQHSLDQQQEKLMPLLVDAEIFNADVEDRFKTAARQSLLQRRQLPTNLTAWGELWQEMFSLPKGIMQHGQQALLNGEHQLYQSQNGGWLAGLVLAWLLLLSWQRRRIQNRLAELGQITEKLSFSVNSLRVLLSLVLRYLSEIALVGLLALFIVLLPLQHILFWLLLSLAGFWLVLQLIRGLAWHLLIADEAPAVYRDPKLYQQLSRLLWLTWIFTSLALFIHYLPFSRPLKELYDSIYILFLGSLAWPLLRLRYLTIEALSEKLSAYWLFVIKTSSLLFILGIVAMSALALLGYINLAWALARFLVGFLLLLTLWLVARGYLNDIIVFVKNYAMQHSPNYGLLWTQDIIPLLHKLLQIALVVTLGWLLLRVNELHVASESVQAAMSYPLLQLSTSSITLGGLILSLFALWFVIWFGKWMRQITYRWIYIGIIDLGVRHSLSAFTQYLIVTIGLVVALDIMGVDLTTLTVFAGAVGVGLGFGLKNVADNFISGLLLLIERPLRAGDIVNIDGRYEGTVKQIGIRSLTVNTWDNQDVIIPNSQLISAPFVNWSRDNWILRTVFYIGVSYNSDLKKVKDLLEGILRNHAEVIKDKPYEYDVFLHEFADSGILFRVQYFIDSDQGALMGTKSKILMEVWEAFKENGIEIPYPQRDVHIKTETT